MDIVTGNSSRTEALGGKIVAVFGFHFDFNGATLLFAHSKFMNEFPLLSIVF